jgi:NitT/TauT family transport system permease protein
MIRRPISGVTKLLLSIASVLSLVAMYTGLSYWQHRRNPSDTSVPTWSQLQGGLRHVLQTDAKDLARYDEVRKVNPDKPPPEPLLWTDAKATGIRLLEGLALSVIGSVIIGLLMGCSRAIEAYMLPPLATLAKVPATAALPVFFVLLKDVAFEWFFTSLIVFGVLPTMAQSIYLAVRDVSDEYLHKAYTLGASHLEVIWDVIVPAILPKILDAMRLTIGPAIVYLIAGEVLCSEAGFGYRIRYEAKTVNMSIVYPYLAILAAFGLIMDYSLRYVQRKACAWYVPDEV